MTTMTLTMDQIKTIYEAGIRRGNDESSAHEWGSSPSGSKFDELEGALFDIVNHGVSYGDAGYVDYDQVEDMVRKG